MHSQMPDSRLDMGFVAITVIEQLNFTPCVLVLEGSVTKQMPEDTPSLTRAAGGRPLLLSATGDGSQLSWKGRAWAGAL